MSSIRLLINNAKSSDLAFAEYAKVHQKINNLRAAGLGISVELGEQEKFMLAQYRSTFQLATQQTV